MNTVSTQISDNKAQEKAQQVAATPPTAPAPPEQELRPDAPPVADTTAGRPKRPRGFAAIDRKALAEIASKGGKAAHSAGTAHEFTSAEAREAGRKGGLATHAKRRKTEEVR